MEELDRPSSEFQPGGNRSAEGKVHLQDAILLIVSPLYFLFGLWGVTVGWNNSILDRHAFRQTQTAISVEYIQQTGCTLRYETPVLGPPWSIPFEFPLYQCLVAEVSNRTHMRLEQAGRLVSVAFFYATLIPLFLLLRDLRFSKIHACATVALAAISPHYIFWSRTFMIESTALFFSVAYLAFFSRATKAQSRSRVQFWTLGVLTAVCGAVAGMVKAPTVVPFLLAACSVLAWTAYKLWREKVPLGPTVLLSLFSVAVPLGAAVWWTHFADRVKSQNALGQYFTSAAIRTWTFGTMTHRLEARFYRPHVMFQNVVGNILGSPMILLLALAMVIIVSRRRIGLFVACLALYVSAIEIFFNVYQVHDYYGYADGLFLIVAIGAAVVGSIEAGGRKSWVGVCLFVLVVYACASHFLSSYYPVQKTNFPGRPHAAEIVASETAPSDVILIFGLDWSPELPYQAHRRAIMRWTNINSIQALTLTTTIESQRDSIGALVACDAGRNPQWESAAFHDLRFKKIRQFSADNCDIFLRH